MRYLTSYRFGIKRMRRFWLSAIFLVFTPLVWGDSLSTGDIDHHKQGYCGRDCAYYIAKHLGIETSLENIGKSLDNKPESSMQQVRDVLAAMGLECQAFLLTNEHFNTLGKLIESDGTCVLCAIPVNNSTINHFVVAERRHSDGIDVYDPASNKIYLLSSFPKNPQYYKFPILVVSKRKIPFLKEKILLGLLLDSTFFVVFCFIAGVAFVILTHCSHCRTVYFTIRQILCPRCSYLLTWKFILLVFLFSLFVIVMMEYFAEKQNHSGPLVIDTQKIDLGELPIGTTKEFGFVIKNSSSKPLVIESVRTSCSCISVLDWPKDIPSGKSKQVKLLAQSLIQGNNVNRILVEPLAGQSCTPVQIDIIFSGVHKASFVPTQRVIDSFEKGISSHILLTYQLKDSNDNPFLLEKVSILHPKSHLKVHSQTPVEINNKEILTIDLEYDGQSSCGSWNDVILLHGKDKNSEEPLVYALGITGCVFCEQCQNGIGFTPQDESEK